MRIDSPERYENLLLAIKYLHSYTDTHIYILEADDTSRISSHLLPQEARYCFIKDTNPRFHRTHYINTLTKQADTPYICICDADAILPVIQLEETADLLRKGFSYVLPYDGSFVMTQKEEKAAFLKTMDCSVFKTTVLLHHVCGGAIFLNREDFIQAGMSNENITSWGPDDVEQKKRMEILGFSMAQVKGPLFHLQHPKCANSSYENPDERIRLTQEYVKIASFGKMELQHYVNTWECVQEYLSAGKKISGQISWQDESTSHCDNDTEQTGLVGSAIVHLMLSSQENHDYHKNKALLLLEKISVSVSQNLPEGKAELAWTIGVIKKHWGIPEHFEKTKQQLDDWLFCWLKAPGNVKAEGSNNIIFIAWYYYSLLTDSCAGNYHPIFYKEQLIFIIDQLYELARREISDYGTASIHSFPRIIGKIILITERLRFLGINMLKTERISMETEKKALEHLSQCPAFQPEDGWLLYALQSKATEMRCPKQYPQLNHWNEIYVRQYSDTFSDDSRLSWIRNSLAGENGLGAQGSSGRCSSVFNLLTDLNISPTWLYSWLFI